MDCRVDYSLLNAYLDSLVTAYIVARLTSESLESVLASSEYTFDTILNVIRMVVVVFTVW